MRPKRLAKIIGVNLVAMSVAAVAIIAFIEGGLRLHYYGSLTPFIGGPHLYKPDPKLGFTPNPGIRTAQERVSYIVPISVNTLGMRGQEIGPKGDKIRIAITGDGHIFGSGLTDEQTLPAQLQAALKAETGSNRFEVVNASGPSYNTVQQLLRMGDLLSKIDADWLILAFNSENDIHYNFAPLRAFMGSSPKRPVARLTDAGALEFDYTAPRRYYEREKWRLAAPKADRPWYVNTALYVRGRVFWRSLGVKGAGDPNIQLGLPHLSSFSGAHSPHGLSAAQYEALWQDAWAVTGALILKLRDTAAERGTRFAITVMPSKIQVDPPELERMGADLTELELDMTRINRMIEDFGKQHNIPVLETLKPLLAARDAGQTGLHYQVFDSHMTPKSHGILAKALANQLLERKLLALE